MDWFSFDHWYALLKLHPQWVTAAIFALSALEAVAVIGIAVPGLAVLFALTLIAGSHGIPLWEILVAGILGAMAGDGISYWLGYRFRDRLPGMWPFRTHPQWLESGRAFIEGHGGKSIIIGRFIGPLRTFVPLVAGMLGMRPLYFLSMNFLSALAWAPLHIFPGYGLGLAMKDGARLATEQIVFICVLFALLWLGGWALRTFGSWFRAPLIHVTQALLRGGIRPLVARAAAIDSEPHAQMGTLLVALACGVAFYVLSHSLNSIWAAELNMAVYSRMLDLRTLWLDHVFVAITVFGDARTLYGMGTLIAIGLLLCRQAGSALHLALAGFFCQWSVTLLKDVYTIPRPPMNGAPETYAFPSGHAISAVLIYGSLVMMAARVLPHRQRWILYQAIVVWVGLLACSRLYLGVHWATDILGGLLIGGFWLALLRFSYYHFVVRTISPRLFMLVVTVAVAVVMALWVAPGHALQMQMYAP